jgi:hypothetical protein
MVKVQPRSDLSTACIRNDLENLCNGGGPGLNRAVRRKNTNFGISQILQMNEI